MVDPYDIREVLEYRDGLLFWRESRGGKLSGSRAFTSIGSHGYYQGSVFGFHTVAHRVVWALLRGVWPEGFIDHINRVKTDNRIENLREVDRCLNGQNAKMRSHNTSGVNGVRWHEGKKRWIAAIQKSGVRHHLGHFENLDDAIAARMKANERFGISKQHGVLLPHEA